MSGLIQRARQAEAEVARLELEVRLLRSENVRLRGLLQRTLYRLAAVTADWRKGSHERLQAPRGSSRSSAHAAVDGES
jgi:hypothetical protein